MVSSLSSHNVKEPVVLRLGVTRFEVVIKTFAWALVSFVDALVQANCLFLQLLLLNAHELPLFSFLQDLEHINSLLMRQLFNERYIHFWRWDRLVWLDSVLPWVLKLIKNAWLIIFRNGSSGSGVCASRICGWSEFIYVNWLLLNDFLIIAVQSLDRAISLQILIAHIGRHRKIPIINHRSSRHCHKRLLAISKLSWAVFIFFSNSLGSFVLHIVH